MKLAFTLAAVASISMGQPRAGDQIVVAPGSQGELVLHMAASQQMDVIDILASGPGVSLAVVLPDGCELTAANAEEMGFSWKTDDGPAPEDSGKLWLAGPGQHTFVGAREELPAGDLRIRVDARSSSKSIQIAALRVTLQEVVMSSLRAIPGVKIAKPVSVARRSKQTALQFALNRTSESAYLDVVVTDPNVKISLLYPDGTLVTEENATAHRVMWELTKWPPTDSDDGFGFGVLLFIP